MTVVCPSVATERSEESKVWDFVVEPSEQERAGVLVRCGPTGERLSSARALKSSERDLGVLPGTATALIGDAISSGSTSLAAVYDLL